MPRVPDRHRRSLSIALFASLLAAMTVVPAVAQDEDASLRVVHAVHDAGSVDVYINGDAAIEALDYSEATEYIDVPAGDYNLRIVAAGGDPDTSIVETDLTLAPGTPHTVVAIGPPDSAEAVTIVDDHAAPAGGGAKLSLINASSDGTEVTLAANGENLVGDIPSADASEYVELEAGAYDLAIVSVQDGAEIATLPGFMMDAGGTYSVFALGVEGDFDIIALVDAGGDTPAPSEPTATPAGSTPEPETPTPGATGTPDGDTTPTPAPTQTPTRPASTPTPAATATVIPSLPDTGAGGATGDDGFEIVPVGVALLVVLLTGLGVWRLSLSKPGAHG